MWGMMSLIKFIYLFIKKFFFWPHHAACRILAPGPSAMKALSPNHWTAREFPHLFILSPDALFVLLAMWRVMPQPFLPYHPRGSGPCPLDHSPEGLDEVEVGELVAIYEGLEDLQVDGVPGEEAEGRAGHTRAFAGTHLLGAVEVGEAKEGRDVLLLNPATSGLFTSV